MRPIGPRIDSERRSRGGWYVRTSGGPFVASGGKHGNCHTLLCVALHCHTLPYVALCGTACNVVHVRRGALTEARFMKRRVISDIPPRLGLPPLRLIATKTNFPLTLFPPGNFFVSRATYSLFDKCTALPYDTCMARGRGRPSAEVIPRRSIDKLRQGYLSNCLPPLDLVANALGVSRSMIGKIIHNRAYYSSAYASQLDIVKERRAQFLLELTDG